MSAGQLVFAAKLFTASMLSYAIAIQIGLTQPYWGIATCCICMNPLTGAIRSKAVFRFVGTLSAGIVSLAIAAVFGSVPALLIVVTGLVATLGFGISFMDRTPRSYGFQLFAVTLILIAVAGVDHPETMFNTAIARVAEIGLGVIATTIIDGMFWPQSLASTLPAELSRWLGSMQQWATDVCNGHQRDAQADHDRLKLLTAISSLSQLTTSLRYDPGIDRRDLQYAFAIQRRLLAMIPLLAAISDRIAALEGAQGIALQPHLAAARACLAMAASLPAETERGLRQLSSGMPPLRAWNGLMHVALADMLGEVLLLWKEIKHIDAALQARLAVDPQLLPRISETAPAVLTPDHGHALRMAAGIGVSYSLICAFWLVTGWSQGGTALILGTVGVAFFGGGDEPGLAIAMFARFTALAFAVAFVVSYCLLPFATDFQTFALVMAALIVPFGMWAAVNPMATLLLSLAVSNLNLQASYAPLDFGAFLESVVATLIVIHIGFLGASLFRRWGAAHQIERFLRIENLDIARISRAATPGLLEKYTSRSLDRMAVMTARLAATGQIERSPQLLTRIAVGINAARLRMLAQGLNPEARLAVERVLDALRRELQASAVTPALLSAIDQAMSTLWSPGNAFERTPMTPILQALVGIRLGLFGQHPAWRAA